jgi:cell division protein FtsB
MADIGGMTIFEIARMLLDRYRIDRGAKIIMAQNQVVKRTAAHLAEVAQIRERIDALEASNG